MEQRRMAVFGIVFTLVAVLGLSGGVWAAMAAGGNPSQALLDYTKGGGGDPQVIAGFVGQGADLNRRDPASLSTPLHFLIQNRNEEAARILVESGAGVNAVDRDGRTPLHDALSYRLPDIARLLIEKGAQVNLRDREGRSTLNNVIYWEGSQAAVDIVNLFATKGFDFKRFVDVGLLNQAISRKGGDIALIFLKNGVAFDEVSVYEAARAGREDVFQALLDRGAQPDLGNLIYGACEAGNLEILGTATARGAKPSEEDIDFCLYHGHKKAAVYLAAILQKEKDIEIDIHRRCRLSPADGSCKALFWKAYYDPDTRTCREFAYGGCGGETPFEDLQACQRVCED
jgi:serine/threonine-protein phosphatase 6 regulatory ankyrin repeat subunit B